ncbi:hypothetical protein TREPR_0536 [Treponema primitia ZAS-2]|uniref:Uncharacterized protein n=1 Tax=Treponema primitia (strain ATCC BAA-887 / DSM 12427 / ZAS-2) TaxID=545694 RepID=F5YLA7_TREPZ|nr:hypothetical protein [Treponema primitia]AEF84253.1 hypothetical protein TREPR_0536 [Treponema primitia ZAS-2]
MFTHNFSVGKTRAFGRAIFLFLVLGLVAGALSLTGCDMDGEEFEDGHQLNPGLIGSWANVYDGYEISNTRLIYNDGGYGLGFSANIVYVYNFSLAAGAIIVKYDNPKSITAYTAPGSYQAVYYRKLESGSVIMGSAYDVATSDKYPDNDHVEVITLEEAILKFSPVNAERYGGASALQAAPLSRQ